MRIAVAAIAVALSASGAMAETRQYREHELGWQERICAGMELEHVLPDRSRIDCLSDTHAIEVELAGKWKEAIGQALYYGAATGKRPGIVLVCNDGAGKCLKAALAIEETVGHYGVGLTLWRCSPDDTELGQCLRIECGPGRVPVIDPLDEIEALISGQPVSPRPPGAIVRAVPQRWPDLDPIAEIERLIAEANDVSDAS